MSEPWASVVAVVRDEPIDRLQRMLDCLAAQEADGEVELILAAPAGEHPRLAVLLATGAVARIVLVDNPTGSRTTGLNLAIARAASSTLHRIDSRSLPARDHLKRCDARLRANQRVGVVGGRQHPVAIAPAVSARGVARALANPWMLGAPAYRRPGASGPVDTVYLGAFRRDELRAIGGYNEALDANEDFELCARYLASGATVWLEDGLVVDYEARVGLGEVWRQYDAFGRSKVRFWRSQSARPNSRQLIGLLAPVIVLAVALGLLRRPRAFAATSVAAAAGLAAVDNASGEAPATVAERGVAVVAGLVIPAAWAVGAYREFFKR